MTRIIKSKSQKPFLTIFSRSNLVAEMTLLIQRAVKLGARELAAAGERSFSVYESKSNANGSQRRGTKQHVKVSSSTDNGDVIRIR
jgi:hypothetical protein